MSGAPLVLLLALGGASTATEAAERVSLPVETDEDSWLAPGLRVGLGYAADALIGAGGTPDGLVHSAYVRAGVRLDRDWSILGTLRYGVWKPETNALRFSGTVEPTLHLLDSLALSAGVGVAGFLIADTGEPTPEPEGTIIASYTFRDTTPLLGRCTGTGVIALVRLEYSWVLGPMFSMGPSAEANTQWTACTEPLGRADPDTGEAIELRQFWRHYSLGLGWSFWWR